MSTDLIERIDCLAVGGDRKPTTPPVYVIDDDGDLRKSLHFLLSTSGITAFPCASAEDFFDHLPTLDAGPILLDMRMPGLDGLETLTMLRNRDVKWPVIVMTAHGDIAIAVKAMKLGAIEFLEKPFRADMLDVALSQAFDALRATGGIDMLQSRVRSALQTLSRREHEVLAVLFGGLSNKLAAHRLGLSTRTIEMHRRNALVKLGTKSVAETIALVASAGTSLSGNQAGDVLSDFVRTLREQGRPCN